MTLTFLQGENKYIWINISNNGKSHVLSIYYVYSKKLQLFFLKKIQLIRLESNVDHLNCKNESSYVIAICE